MKKLKMFFSIPDNVVAIVIIMLIIAVLIAMGALIQHSITFTRY